MLNVIPELGWISGFGLELLDAHLGKIPDPFLRVLVIEHTCVHSLDTSKRTILNIKSATEIGIPSAKA